MLFIKHCYDLNGIFSCGKLTTFSEIAQSQSFQAYRVSQLPYQTNSDLGQVTNALRMCSICEKLVFRP